MIDYVILLGITAGILSTIASLPQLIKVIRTRTTRDLSLAALAIGLTGSTLWLIYGLCIGSLPLIGSNCVGLILNSAILGYKLRYH
ncbi:MAG: hypothetical protein METHP_01622 [Methanoregula sp. SKADARSKE-2]|nr:MAG: hypothetical protein METHP_01622 [Methanoregula sp. SKADARSKE-2]